MVRLGQGVDATGRLAPDALTRAFAAIDDYAALIAAHDAQRIRFCATSATRDAENAAEFTAGVRARLGIDPEVLSGDEEARLSFDGAIRGTASLPEPVLVIDIGGGSTELILGDRETGPRSSYSMDIGSVRLHERCLGGDPPPPDQIRACLAAIDAALDTAIAEGGVDPAEAASVIGVAGTITTVAAGVLGLTSYDRERNHGQVLGVDEVHRCVSRIVGAKREARLASGYIHPGRVDVIDAGALILSSVLRRTRMSEMTVAETDILDGIAWSLAD
jgi:exopolyphosphatase/guanosine-5'-triphosphate,3'-diphosphate pyrophosphatase